jgi:hypothetical protein
LFARQGQSATEAPVKLNGGTSGWRVPAMLRDMGLAPMHAHQFVDHLQSRHGERAPASLREEISIACSVLAEFWDRKPAPTNGSSVHVFVGPFGAGKTTVICKWLTQTTLLAGHSARVWRLDGATANTAESLSVYGEILGVPVARSLTFGEGAPPDIGFIDLPGVDWRDAAAVRELARRLTELPRTSRRSCRRRRRPSGSCRCRTSCSRISMRRCAGANCGTWCWARIIGWAG